MTLSAGLIIIGNEILSGRTQDTNTQWLCTKMMGRGIRMAEVRIVPDIEDEIIAAIQNLKSKVTYLFTTGGIGPTHDDITAEAVAKAVGKPLILDPRAREILLNYYGSEDQLNPARLKMAMIPEGAALINNPVSGAPGFHIENIFVMAGVPRIMQAMLDDILLQIEAGPPILSNTVTCALGESVVAADLEVIQNKYPSIEIGSYPHYRAGVLGLSLVLRSTDNESLNHATVEVVDIIHRHGGAPRAISVQSTGIQLKTYTDQ
jgi:molybdenum cofactor synthesis domain-containing protein